MTAVLSKTEDYRDNLQKASRYELVQFAKANGVSEITYECELGLEEMVTILRKRGLTNIKIPHRPLGVYKPVILGNEDQPKPPQESVAKKSVAQMSMNELRSECKRLGIKMSRRDTLESLREKLNGQNAA